MNKRSLIAGGLIFLMFVVASTFFVVRWNNPDPDDGPDARNANRDAELDNEFVPATLLPLDVEKIENDPQLKVDVVRDELLVTLHRPYNRADLEAILKLVSPDAKVVGQIPAVNMYQVQLDSKLKFPVRQKLSNHPWVAAAAYNVVRYALKVKRSPVPKDFNDPSLNNNDPVDDWGIQKIGAVKAWDRATGSGVKIAVVDSGTLLDHEEVTGKIVDPFSYGTRSATMQIGEFTNVVTGRKDFIAGHGTHVAVTSAGIGNNSKGTIGIAPESTIQPIQVLYFRPKGDQSQGRAGIVTGSAAEIVAGITRAIEKGADVVNLSLGRGWDRQTLNEYYNGDAATRRRIEKEVFIPARDFDLKAYAPAIDLAARKNVILVNAAGNDNIPAKFGAFTFSGKLISVAATDESDQRAGFSNYGTATTVSAPGVKIYSAFSQAADSYVSLQGTSMAAPHVAGAVALMRQLKSDLTFEEARDILVSTGVKLNPDQPIGPRIDLVKALEETLKRKNDKTPTPEPEDPLLPEPPVEKPPVDDAPNPPKNPAPKDPPSKDPAPKDPPKNPVPEPTPEEIVNGPAPWLNPKVQNLIDLWLSIATPPLDPVDGRPWFYDEWGRHLNNYNVWANYEPDHGGMTRHQWVWQFARKLDSTRHGTLYEFVLSMLKTGKFDPAPIRLPSPSPGDGKNPKSPRDGSSGKKPKDRPEGNTPNKPKNPGNTPGKNPPIAGTPKVPTLVDLKGRWKGKNGEGKEIALTFFEGQSAWLIRDGVNPVAYQAKIDTAKEIPALVLSVDGKERFAFSIAMEGEKLKARTYFNTSRLPFSDKDQRYTYRLDRIDREPGETDLMKFGFRNGSFRLRSNESIVVGSKPENLIQGTRFTMPKQYQVVDYDLSRDGSTLWFVIDNRYPEKGTKRERQVWSMDLATGKTIRSEIELPAGYATSMCCSANGKIAWMTLDYSIPAAVQPKREFKIYRGEPGKPFQLVADTGKNDQIASLGLAQVYDTNTTVSGDALWFTDRKNIWRVNSAGFQKIADKEMLKKLGVTPYGNLHGLLLAADGQTWLCTTTVKEGASTVHLVVRGNGSGMQSIVAKSTKTLARVEIADDLKRISYHDSDPNATKVGTAAKVRELAKIGRWVAFGTKYLGNGDRFYAVMGSIYTADQRVGFIEELATGNRLITHSKLQAGPSPGALDFSANGSKFVGLTSKSYGISLVSLDSAKSVMSLDLVMVRVRDGAVDMRVKVPDGDAIGKIELTALHENYIQSNEAMKYSENPFKTWGGKAQMRRSKVDGNYFESTTVQKDIDQAGPLKTTTFFLSIQSKDRKHISNYLLRFDK